MPRIRDNEVLDEKIELKLHVGPGLSPDGELLWDPSKFQGDEMYITLRGELHSKGATGMAALQDRQKAQHHNQDQFHNRDVYTASK